MDNKLKHIAIIVDGNRTWARRQGLPSFEGHRKGADNIEVLLTKARDLGIKCVTMWAFSTENWKRSPEEVKYLFDIFRGLVSNYKEKFLKEKTRFVHAGRKDRLPADLVQELISLEEETKDFPDFTVCLCLDYGGHDELMRAINKLAKEGKELNEENIESALDTSSLSPIDLIIRTGGQLRLSGFMSWQSAYAEFYFTQKCFPEFTTEDLEIAINEFYTRERKFGGDSKVAVQQAEKAE